MIFRKLLNILRRNSNEHFVDDEPNDSGDWLSEASDDGNQWWLSGAVARSIDRSIGDIGAPNGNAADANSNGTTFGADFGGSGDFNF